MIARFELILGGELCDDTGVGSCGFLVISVSRAMLAAESGSVTLTTGTDCDRL